MKKTSRIGVLISLLAMLVSCRHNPPSPATLILGFGKTQGDARAFAPEDIAVSSINIDCTGPGGAKVAASSSDCSAVELELLPGDWVITAKGYNDKGEAVASGFLELSLGPSELLRRDILLMATVGTGSISLSWTLAGSPGGSLSLEGSLSSPAGTVLPIQAPSSASDGSFLGGPLRLEGLQSGSWTLELRLLKDGSALCGLADAVLVGAGMETKISVSFKPPEALLSLGIVLPDYSSPGLHVEPSLRRGAGGAALCFRAPPVGALSWYAEGCPAGSGTELDFRAELPPGGSPRGTRIDCVFPGASLARSGSAEAWVYPNQELGPLSWGEVLNKSEGSASAQAAMKALGDCRDIAWTEDGSRLCLAGKEANALSLFEAGLPGSTFPLACLDTTEAPALSAPSLLRPLPGAALVAISESAGAAYYVKIAAAAPGSESSASLSLTASLSETCLAGAKDLLLLSGSNCAYVAASEADCIALLDLGQGGAGLSARAVASKGMANLSGFSRPYCLALSPDGAVLAVGTAGDDAIYFFDRDRTTNALSFRSRLDKTAFPVAAPLSDPCALAFSPEGSSLFVLSYYGKALIRLDRDARSGLFTPVAGAKSGLNGVLGFATPKRMALSPDGRLLAVIGSGAEDGLALFRVGDSASLLYSGCLLPAQGRAIPKRPSALAFSPDGRTLAVAADGYLSLFEVKSE
jgi:hypothetical protein